MSNNPVLVLSVSYQPFDVWSWQKAMRKLLGSHSVLPVYKPDGDIIKYDRILLDGQGNEYELPAIVVLKKYIKIQGEHASYSKTNIYARDMLKCQYCGELTTPLNRSVDHVIPRFLFNPKKHNFRLSSFENVVTCCKKCNLYKGDKTLKQTGMTLIKRPTRPLRDIIYKNKLSLITNKPHQWESFLTHDIKEKIKK